MNQHITRGGRVLSSPVGVPAGETWVYQLALPFQVSPTRAGLFVNIRKARMNIVDLEAGNDVVLFDKLADLPAAAASAVPVNRGVNAPHPRTGQPIFLAKYPIAGGFVPLGAKRRDGSPHPHAGSGFGLSSVIGFPVADAVKRAPDVMDRYDGFEFQQYAYDGRDFRVTDTRLAGFGDLFDGWRVINRPIGNAIPDGDGMVMGLAAAQGDDVQGACFSRWARIDGAWRITGINPVSGPDGSFEPSLIRDTDGSLLMSARDPVGSANAPNVSVNEKSIRVWRSTDHGLTWEKILHAADTRACTPVTLNLTVDGTAYIASNPDRALDSFGRKQRHSILMRETLQLWPLTGDRRGLGGAVLIRDCNADFGAPPGGSTWYADHPTGCNLRLADGRWRHVLCYRCLEQNENQGDQAPTPHTGCYVEEVTAAGPANPAVEPWRF